MKPTTLRMFTQDDLPLFSGSCARPPALPTPEDQAVLDERRAWLLAEERKMVNVSPYCIPVRIPTSAECIWAEYGPLDGHGSFSEDF